MQCLIHIFHISAYIYHQNHDIRILQKKAVIIFYFRRFQYLHLSTLSRPKNDETFEPIPTRSTLTDGEKTFVASTISSWKDFASNTQNLILKTQYSNI